MTTLDNTLNAKSKSWTPEEKALIDANAMDDDIFADRLFEQLEAAPAFFSKKQMYEIENKIQSDAYRRAAFAFATLSGKKLCKKVAEDRELALSAANLLNALDEIKGRYTSLIEVFDGLQGRLMLSLCGREDMQQILDEAGKEQKNAII